jgi:hypothetical protein
VVVNVDIGAKGENRAEVGDVLGEKNQARHAQKQRDDRIAGKERARCVQESENLGGKSSENCSKRPL